MDDEPLRIALLINELSYGGGQRVFVDDANRLARVGARVTLCTLYREPAERSFERELDPSIELVRLDASGPFDVGAIIRCARLLRARGVEVMITTLNHANVLGRFVVLALGRRFRLIRREANEVQWKRAWQRILDGLLDGITDRILVLSAADSPHAGKRVVLRNAVALPPLEEKEPRAAPRLLTVARVTWQKDHATLIAALGLLAAAGHAFTAEIIGHGTLLPALKEQALRAGIGDRVLFRGPLPHLTVLSELSKGDLFVLSSRFEGCPNALLEAMARGLPVVVTSVGGMPEVVEHEVSGLLVPTRDPRALADALARLLASAELRTAMGDAARARAALFDPDIRFDRLHRIVLSAVRRGPDSGGR